MPPPGPWYLPAERDPHAATWTSWPSGEALWEGMLGPVRTEFATLVATVARFEPVVVNVRDAESEADARARLHGAGAPRAAVRFHSVPLDDVWLRDNGPLFVKRRGDGAVALTDWGFDGWGGKFDAARDARVPAAMARHLGALRLPQEAILEGGALEPSGDGTALTTRSCLLDTERNAGWTEADYAQALAGALGITRLVWLEGGLVDDHTDGHVDMVARFADAGTVLCARADPDDADNRGTLDANEALLRDLKDANGMPYRVVPLPLAAERRPFAGRRLPLTYANVYVGNGFVVAPQYDDPRDEVALRILRSCFPEREVIGLPASALITGGGAFHCVTQQQPAGPLARDGGANAP